MAKSTERFKTKLTISVDFPYILHLPKNYIKKETYPLIVFLHGAGERGDNTKLMKVGLPTLLQAARAYPFILIAPQCPVDSWWTRELNGLSVFIKSFVNNYPIDKKRIYLTGLSMGGDGAWRLAALHPEWFAALAPICGRDKTNAVDKLKTIPTWAFHGKQDDIVPVNESRKIVRGINALGGDAKLTVYPDADHNAWDRAYKTPELYQWLFAQTKQQNSNHLAHK
jgi:predicted peptidase